jgi:uncharacterized protein (TIGR03083 family)
MRIDDYVAALRRDGELLAEAVAKADPDAPVPTCPGWTVRELAQHMGRVHRWATAYVRDGRAEAIPAEQEAAVWGPMPDDAALVGWLRAGHAALVASLATQAHETAIHRADGQTATGAVDTWPVGFAVDGIDELLVGFYGRPTRRFQHEPPVTLGLRAADAGLGWTLHIGPDRLRVDRASGDADCVVEGGAAELYLLLWNRRGAVTGDPVVLQLWRERAGVRWS